MTRAEKIAAKKLDNEINAIYMANRINIKIPIMDIPKLFSEARKARAEGRDMMDVILNFVQKIRKN
jgi:hypothetical protein